MSRTASALLVAAFLGIPPAAAGEEAAAGAPTAALAPYVHAMALDAGGGLTGPGAERLRTELERAHFFMLGEQHATADIAALATALFRVAAPLGYRHAVIEVGPAGASRLETLLRAEDPEALAAYFATGTNLFSIPFFFFQEEAAFARAVVAASPASPPALWGVDQEFIAGAGPVLDRLAELATTDAERAAVATAREEAAANPMFLGASPAERIAALADAFAGSSSAEARQRARELVASNRIYAPFTGRGGSVYEANLERETLMKTTFLERYRAVRQPEDAPPRVFVKLGANHVFRGLSPTHVPSFGSFLFELAVTEGVRAYNLHVDCRGGSATDAMSGGPSPCASYFLGADSVLLGALPPTPAFVDLRALRSDPAALERLDPSSRDLVWAFDGYVAMPETKPATFFPGERPRIGG